MKRKLSIQYLQVEAKNFAKSISVTPISELFNVTDGKAIGTFVEHKFKEELQRAYKFDTGNSAKGKDFPGLNVDLKVTRTTQPQSSCPYKSAAQKIFGLGYSLLIFVYDKTDDIKRKVARLKIMNTIFIDASRTADYQMTTQVLQILKNNGNKDDLIAVFADRNLPVDDIQAEQLAERILMSPPIVGYLTISNALQWRLQYRRAIEEAGKVQGIIRIT